MVVIDLQKGIVNGRNLVPISGSEVVSNAAMLVRSAREAGSFIVGVHVGSKDGKDMLNVNAEGGMMASPHSKDWSDFVPEVGFTDSDHIILKHSWSAFYGTDLDLQLRRRKIKMIILCGISTNIGVESTARDAYHRGYNQIFITDAMAASTLGEHECTVKYIFPRIGTRASTDEIVASISH